MLQRQTVFRLKKTKFEKKTADIKLDGQTIIKLRSLSFYKS